MGSALIEAWALRNVPKPCGCERTRSTASSMSLAMPSVSVRMTWPCS